MAKIEWNVKNGLNRDIERQHLNKILADIRSSVTTLESAASTSSSNTTTDNHIKDVVGTMVSDNTERGVGVSYNITKKVLDFAIAAYTIRLTGDVTGSATVDGLGTVTIATELDESLVGVTEAPIDNSFYWRQNGDWQVVNPIIANLEFVEGVGFAAYSVDDFEPAWNLRTFIPPAAGFTITNPAGEAGNPTFVLANDLAAVEGLTTLGIAVRTALETWTTRTLQQPAAGLTITNPAGIAGDPTFVLANDLAGLEGLAGTGFAVRTATDTWANRSIGNGPGVIVTNGNGVAGNVTVEHSDTSSVSDVFSDNSGTVVIQDVSITFDTFGHVQTCVVNTVDVASALSGTYQPLDATLTALAAANWAANALPIGSGADTVAQVTFGANTFPARASTGNLVAKTITDFGLSLVDDVDASAARTTLGLGTAAVADDSDYVHIAGTETVTGAKLFAGSGSGVQLANPTWQWRTETATRRYRWQYVASDAADGAYNLDKWNGAAFVNVLNVNTGATILTMVGNISASVLVSTVATGTAPFTVTSTTKVTNLNADLLDDQSGAFYLARANHTGTQTMSTISDLPTLAHGTYTPTLTNTTNLDASTAYACQYLRVGNTVTVSGKVDMDPTAAGTTELRMSLPIASTFASEQQCGGTAAASAIHQSVRILGGASVTTARFVFQAPDGTNRSYNFSFTYLVV